MALHSAIAQPASPLVDAYIRQCWSDDLDPDDVRDILARMKVEAEKGLAAIEAALVRADLAAVRKSAHKLKGMMGNLGATRIADVLRQIEVGAVEQRDVTLLCSTLPPLLAESLAAFGVE